MTNSGEAQAQEIAWWELPLLLVVGLIGSASMVALRYWHAGDAFFAFAEWGLPELDLDRSFGFLIAIVARSC